MSIKNDKIIDNNNIKNKNEIGMNININNHILKKNINFNIDKILSKVNFSLSRNRKANHKNILTEELFANKLNSKKFRKTDSKNHKKNLTNIYDTDSFSFKPEINYDLKKLTEKNIFENKMHRRIQTERQNIEIIKKINKSGNRYVLLNSINTQKNNGITTKYLFEGKINKVNSKINSLKNYAYINLTINKSFQKKKYFKKINPHLTINTEYKSKKSPNNFCLKSCNLENNQHTSKKKKIYPIKKRNKRTENIFKTQSKVRNNFNYYSQDNSISNIKSTNLKKKMKDLHFPKRKIYLSSKNGQSFELHKKIKVDFLSSSNINIKSYTNSFDDDNKNKNKFFSALKKNNDIHIEKPMKKKSSNFNLNKILPDKLQNIFKDNLKANNLIYIKENKIMNDINSKPIEPKPIINKYKYSTDQNSIKQIKCDDNNKSKEKFKKGIKKNHQLNEIESLSIRESINIKNPIVNLNLKLNKDSKTKIKEFLNHKKFIKRPKNSLIKPKSLSFQSKNIVKIESLLKKGFWKPGIEKANQDNYFILDNINNNSKYIYMGVCDGHGIYGKEVSNFLINNLPQNLNKNIINNKIKYLSFESINNLSNIIINSFNQTNNELINNKNINTDLSGSTCVSILFTPRRLISINVGDSRCILGKFNGEKWQSKNLSRDHKPSEEDEKNRIILNGGRVEQNRDEFGNGRGPLRIWLKDEEIPGLAISRTFGDEIAHKIGVTNEPEIEEYIFLSEDKFFILASDGLWEYISSEECVDLVKDYYIKNDIEGAINFLYKESSKRWIMKEDVIDDITVIIAFMN